MKSLTHYISPTGSLTLLGSEALQFPSQADALAWSQGARRYLWAQPVQVGGAWLLTADTLQAGRPLLRDFAKGGRWHPDTRHREEVAHAGS